MDAVVVQQDHRERRLQNQKADTRLRSVVRSFAATRLEIAGEVCAPGLKNVLLGPPVVTTTEGGSLPAMISTAAVSLAPVGSLTVSLAI